MNEPPAFWTGSTITMATVLGAGLLDGRLELVEQEGVNCSSVSSGGRWKRLVFDTCSTSGTSGSNGVRSSVQPLMESAPMVVPW